MNKDYVEYDADGRITCVCNLSPDAYEDNKHKPMIEGRGIPAVNYVKDGKLATRPLMQVERELNVLKNLPVPCQIIINDAVYDCNEPTVELEFDQPGTYSITVRAWPYIDKEFVYENTAQ